jgi:serine phosphatase RsbU (regulator of sigma subunit)
MALTMSASAIHAQATSDPGEVLGALLRSLRDELTSTEMFISVFYAVVDRAAGELRYANAGHPTPMLLQPDGKLVRLDGHRSPMIGAVPDLGRASGPGRTEAELRCRRGSLLLLYTDGLTDVAGDDADERTLLLEETLASAPAGADAETVVERVLTACVPRLLRDDVAVLAGRLTG